jgi:hypothetical protein
MNRIVHLAGLVLALTLGAGARAGDGFMVVQSKKGGFEDVRDDVVLAIEARGIKINHTNYIADMLARTGADLGAGKPVYLKGEQVEFCKSDLSRAQMEADPGNMVFCPYILSIYTLPADPGTVHVAYRKPVAAGGNPATAKALKAVEDLLAGIVREALN